MKRKKDNLEKGKHLKRGIWKRLLALTCVVGLGIADISTASAMSSSIPGTFTAVEQRTGTLTELENDSELEKLQEEKGKSDSEKLQESGGEPELEKPQETGGESELEKPQETGGESELEKPQETDGESELEKPQETDGESELEKPQETGGESELEKPQETGGESELEKPQETDGESSSEKPQESESSSEIDSSEETSVSPETKETITAPGEPILKSAASSSYNSVKVKWETVEGAQGYRVYRKTSGTSWKRIAELGAKNNSWEDTGLTCGQKYIYTVRAFVKNQDQYLLSTYNKTGVTGKPVPKAPSLESMVSEASSVTINWKTVDGVTNYYIYRKEPGGKWKRIASVKKGDTSYRDKKASKGIRYIYTVKGMHNDVKGKYNSKGIEGAVQVQSITMKSISISSGGTARIKWGKRSGADGYYIYRKKTGGKWKRLKAVSAKKSSWSEKGLESDTEYIYTVVGYMKLNGKAVKGRVNSKGIAPKLEYTGNFVRNVTKTYLGTSGEGRKMYSYTIGGGENHIVITMAIHGWEDEWKKDGAALVKTGEQLIRTAAGKTSVLKENNYSIIIIPMGNPDGLYSGTTCNGPGRCTTYRYNNSGKLVKGGVDLNRCFPSGFSAQYGTRNYTGDKPLMAKEASILKKFIDSNKGDGKNIFIDAHGWYNQTITPKSGSGSVYRAFKKYFSGTRPSSLGKGYGYISAYASNQGYNSVLFEFPNISSESQFTKNGYANKYINTIFYMVKNI